MGGGAEDARKRHVCRAAQGERRGGAWRERRLSISPAFVAGVPRAFIARCSGIWFECFRFLNDIELLHCRGAPATW